MHTVPAQQYAGHPLSIVATVTEALGNGLKDWVGILLLYWGWLIFKDWKTHGYTRTLVCATVWAAVSLALCYGVTVVLAVPTLKMLIQYLFLAMTAIVLVTMAIVLGIAQLWKNKKSGSQAQP